MARENTICISRERNVNFDQQRQKALYPIDISELTAKIKTAQPEAEFGDFNDDGLVDPVDASLILCCNAFVADNGTATIYEWYQTI